MIIIIIMIIIIVLIPYVHSSYVRKRNVEK